MTSSSALVARITARAALRYDAGADPREDRPAHVRAGSALAHVETHAGPRLVVAQDDAAFLAVVALDPRGAVASVQSVALPAGPGGARQFDEGRGNKMHKLDLECAFVMSDASFEGAPVVVALGSGSAPARERLVLLRLHGERGALDVVEVPALYAALRAHALLDGAELNLEGAALLPDGAVRLFQRGNGAGGVNATFDLDSKALLAHARGRGPLPSLERAQRWELGAVDGVRLTFTDAVAVGDEVWVTAAAEASPNAIDDGVVVACALGVLGRPLSPILDENGRPFVGKPEGLAVDPVDPRRAWIVLDKDDPHAPAELLTLAIDGVAR
jgi:hypothetical protein